MKTQEQIRFDGRILARRLLTLDHKKKLLEVAIDEIQHQMNDLTRELNIKEVVPNDPQNG